MSVLLDREQLLELCLKAELDEAERQLRDATPQEKEQARLRFKQALHNFTLFVLEGKRTFNA